MTSVIELEPGTLPGQVAEQAACSAAALPASPGVLHRILLVALFGGSLMGALRIAALPPERLALNFAVDDAFYYLVPARQLLEGRDYALDGETRTNGVQPLWALVSISLRALFPADGADVQALVLLSGVLWIAAGGVLYAAVRRFDPWLALVAATGFVLTGFGGRLAFQGMENGLHAFLCASLIWTGTRYLAARPDAGRSDRPRFYLGLGSLLALVTLARIDSAPAALIIGLLVLTGLVRPGAGRKLAWNPRGAVWLALPGCLVAGGYLVFSYLYFGNAFPISGTLKMYYQSVRPELHGGMLGSIAYHLKMMYKLTTTPVAENVEQALRSIRGTAQPLSEYRMRFMLLLAAGGIAALVRVYRRRREYLRPGAWQWFATGLTVFAGLHLLLYATRLSHFTDYGTWYFAPEVMALWLLYAALIAAVGRWITRLRLAAGNQRIQARPLPGGGLAALVAVCMLISAVQPIRALGDDNKPVPIYQTVGQWLNERLPANTRIGCFSSGIVSYAAPAQRIVNLDGLMNNRAYFQNYLKQNRISEYLRDRQIGFFCDYGSTAAWQGGRYWGMDLTRMQLVRWWPMWDDLSYALWQVCPDGRQRDVLEVAEGPCDRISQIQYAAEILGRFRVVPEEHLAGVLAEPASADLRVITSIVDPPSRRLRHVLAPRGGSAELLVKPGQCDIATAAHVVFGGALELLGYDLPDRTVPRGGRLVVTRYWTVSNSDHDFDDISFELWLNPPRPQDLNRIPPELRILHQTRACHTTYPIRQWREGEIVAETYSIHIPLTVAPGHYPVMLALWDASNRWLLPELPGADPSAPGMLLGSIEIR